jgi:hypothetical protein
VKYGCDLGGWSSREVSGPYGVSLWKYIRHGWNSFCRFLKFDIGDGTQVRFWYDLWCGDHPLKEEFLEFFVVACIRNASVADLLLMELFIRTCLLPGQCKIRNWNLYRFSWIYCTQFW